MVVLDNSTETLARNERRACVMIMSTQSAFEIVQGVLDLLMTKIGARFGLDYCLAEN